MFFRDPSGNALEIKAMANPANLFANRDCPYLSTLPNLPSR